MSSSTSSKAWVEMGLPRLLTECSLELPCLIFLMVPQRTAPPRMLALPVNIPYHLPVGSYPNFQKLSPGIRKAKGKADEWHGFY